MLRRWRISLAALAIAAAPAAAALTTATTSAAASHSTVNAPASASHVTVTHGILRNGGVAVRVGNPGGKVAGAQGKVGHATAQSTNWSGYAATGSTYTTVSASWVQPTGSCTSAARYSSFWVGLDGYNSNSVEQTGTDTDCSGGRPVYYGWYEMFPNPSFSFGSTVNAGDTMTATVAYQGSNSYKLTLQDVTRGWTATTTKTLSGAPRSSAEVIIEAPCCTASGGILPLANFGTVHFSGSVVNGSAIGNFNPVQITMVNNSGQPKDSISALSGGESFSGTWIRAS